MLLLSIIIALGLVIVYLIRVAKLNKSPKYLLASIMLGIAAVLFSAITITSAVRPHYAVALMVFFIMLTIYNYKKYRRLKEVERIDSKLS